MTPQEWLSLVHCPTNTKYSARDLLALAETIIKELVK